MSQRYRRFISLLIGSLLLLPAPKAHASGSAGLLVLATLALPVTFPWLIAGAIHGRHNVDGCVSNSGTGLSIRDVDHHRDYALTGNTAGISAGKSFDLVGHKRRDAAKDYVFEVDRVKDGPLPCVVAAVGPQPQP